MADINNPPAGGFQHGGWYWNPGAKQAQRYWNGSFLPVGQTDPAPSGGGRSGGGGGGGAPSAPSAEEIMRRAAEERNRKYQEQAKVWNEFMSSPTFWDAILARQMAEQYFNPYYQTVLPDSIHFQLSTSSLYTSS